MTLTLTYNNALQYLAQFINYEARQRVPYDPTHFSVQSFADFLRLVHSPHLAFPSVLIAGSKGKGSTAAMIAAVLTQAGLRTGLFTKPHLVTIRERTQIDRQMISEEEFTALVGELQSVVEAKQHHAARRFRTFFELTTALSFLHFARHQVDIAVVEVGLGGRLDTTNVLTPRVAVLMPIGLEHTHILGSTLPEIAGEKAGIIKPHSCVVSALQAPEVVEVFARRCQDQEAVLLLAGRDFHHQLVQISDTETCVHVMGCEPPLADLHVALLGRHQAANAAVAVTVIRQLQQQGWPITDEHIRQGLATVQWEGRLEIVERSPWVVLDAAHTVESAQCLRQALEELFPAERRLLVLGMAADKNVPDIVATLAPIAHDVIVTRSSNPRACDPERLAQEVRRHSVTAHVITDPLAAFAFARAQAQPADLVCVTGSLLLLGEIKARWRGLSLEF